MEIRIAVRFTVAPSSRMHTFSLFSPTTPSPISLSLFLFQFLPDAPATTHLGSSPSPDTRLRTVVLSLVSTFSAFCFLLSNDVVGTLYSGNHPGAECDTRRYDSSTLDARQKKSYTCDVVSSTESNFYLYRTVDAREKVARVRLIIFFFFPFFRYLREESTTSVGIAAMVPARFDKQIGHTRDG